MPLLNFKPQFVEPIRSGRKHHTIRATRAIPIKRGDNLYLYTGLRHKGAFRILAGPVVCTKVQSITIKIAIEDAVEIDGERLSLDECETLARADGFDSWSAMREFWQNTHGEVKPAGVDQWQTVCVDFKSQIIHWK